MTVNQHRRIGDRQIIESHRADGRATHENPANPDICLERLQVNRQALHALRIRCRVHVQFDVGKQPEWLWRLQIVIRTGQLEIPNPKGEKRDIKVHVVDGNVGLEVELVRRRVDPNGARADQGVHAEVI